MASLENHDMIGSITIANRSWHIKGRIIYSWEQIIPKTGEVTNLDFIITDSEGKDIHASIAKRFFFKYKSLVKDGEVRYLTNFSVVQNTGEYRVTKHPFKIVFTAKTIFSTTTDVIIPDRSMEFASFNDIIHNNLDANYLVDVIGQLDGKSPIDVSTSGIKSMQVMLLDCEGRKLIYTLWQKFAEQMHNNINELETSKHCPIIIIRYAKIKSFRDSKLCNSLCSRMLIDPEIPEVRSFIRRRMEIGLQSSSSSLTHLSSHSEILANELLDLSVRRTIAEIKEIQEERYFVTLATITAINTEYRWYLESCKTCRASVELDDKGKWICTGTCDGYAKFVVLKYKVRVNVVDDSGNCTFILFDTHSTDLIKQSAKQLREKQLKHGDPNTYPSELDILLNRRFLFKIKVDEKYNLTMGWKSYRISKLSEYTTLIGKFLETSNISEKTEVDSRDESVLQNDREKESVHSTVEDGSVSSALIMTPAKRTLEKCLDEDEAQLSTTKKQVVVKVHDKEE
ncbi:hypothetical protein RND81_10G145900 [Saponaria officinalis]|uniref:Uncharacterized protein n=1 Tax=Saponaria officinalis TaxID=3572 RepID=A0AAW1I3J9_SAPOF